MELSSFLPRYFLALWGDSMPHLNDELWKHLCEEASTEQDPDRLLELIQEINRLIDEKRLGLHGTKADSQPSNELDT
jgi:hypothetical protein